MTEHVQADDPEALGDFWASFLDVMPDHYSGMAYLPAHESGGVPMMFQPPTTPRPDHQDSHLDLAVPWGQRGPHVDRAVSLGATCKWDVLDKHPHVRWTTIADPEGNLFCIAEHPPTDAG